VTAQDYSAPSTGAGSGNGPDVSQSSVGQLIGDVSRDLSSLMRQELELAKVELKTEVTKTRKAAGMLGGAGFAGYMVLLFLSIALWAGLSNVMDAGWAGLLVAAVWAVIGTVLGVTGRSRLRSVHPKPERTVETVQQIPEAFTNR
jgi:hypothetical protein